MLSFSIISCLIANTVKAEELENGFLLGVKGGYQYADDDAVSSMPSSWVYGIYTGYRFSPSWSFDVGYLDQTELNEDHVDVDTWLIESAIRYDYWLSQDWSLYGRLGVAYWDVEKEVSSESVSDTGFSPVVETGIGYALTANLTSSLGYQYIGGLGDEDTIGAYDSHAVMLNVSYVFGSHSSPSEDVVTQTEAALVSENGLGSTVVMQEEPLNERDELDKQLANFASDAVAPHFLINSSSVSSSEKPNLDKQLNRIKDMMDQYPQIEAHFVGHTDTSGPADYNFVLSERRAKTISEQLIGMGVPKERIHVSGMGEKNAVQENNPDDRRVELILICSECE